MQFLQSMILFRPVVFSRCLSLLLVNLRRKRVLHVTNPTMVQFFGPICTSLKFVRTKVQDGHVMLLRILINSFSMSSSEIRLHQRSKSQVPSRSILILLMTTWLVLVVKNTLVQISQSVETQKFTQRPVDVLLKLSKEMTTSVTT